MFVLTQQQWSLTGLCFKHRNKTTTLEKHGRVGGKVVKPDFTFPPVAAPAFFIQAILFLNHDFLSKEFITSYTGEIILNVGVSE